MTDQREGGIAWTDETWNPLRGCSRVSEGCRHCYAEKVAARFNGPGQPYEGLVRLSAEGKHGRARWNGTVRFVPEKLDEPLRWKRPRRVFVNSMSDLFHESVPFEQIDDVFGVMAACRFIGRDAAPGHVFQVLTKRPERMREYLATDRRTEWAHTAVGHGGGIDPDGIYEQTRFGPRELPNVWLGVSVEDQATADARIPVLLHTRAAVRWVSYEPALGLIDFTKVRWYPGCRSEDYYDATAGLDWIVVGGESGPGARAFDLAWARSAIAQTRGTGCAVFVKQLGSRPIADHKNVGGLRWSQVDPRDHGHGDDHVRVRLADRKGGDPSEWPEDVRVREWPAQEVR